jgi:hypothetical protein
MVASWMADEEIERQTRRFLLDELSEFRPRILAAHSLGSLIAYDTLRRMQSGADEEIRDRLQREPELAAVIENLTVITLGSQLAHPALTSRLGGRIETLPVRHWYNLHNPNDDVFVVSLGELSSLDNFTEVVTCFDQTPWQGASLLESWSDHCARRYLTHPQALELVWRPVLSAGSGMRTVKPRRVRQESLRSRALLVGINDYPNPGDRLQGCLNDIYSVSQTLQERGFRPGRDIEMLADRRATTDNLRQWLKWLLEDADSGGVRLFYFSGHGAQVPLLVDDDNESDRLDECLVTYDFDWHTNWGLRDGEFRNLYAQLPYDARVLAVFDCCHAAGMSRGPASGTRGLQAPPDIRHRLLSWNGSCGRWQERPAQVSSLGKAMGLRAKDFRDRRQIYGHAGPFMPVVFNACQEHELAFEHSEAHQVRGAFSASLLDALCSMPSCSYRELYEETSRRLRELGYPQHPKLEGPREALARVVL